MAPGCYSPSSTKQEQHVEDRASAEQATTAMTVLMKPSSSCVISSLEMSSERIINQIPLPLTPPPPRTLITEDDDESDDEEEEEAELEEEEEEDDDENDDESDDEDEEEAEQEEKKEGNHHLLKVTSPRLKSVGKRSTTANLIFDTADTFEILEQTIIKQKRLAKLKNTDLRRKVLLKRTFDLVLEIMDAENGFNDDLDSPPSTPQPSHTIKIASRQPIAEEESTQQVSIEGMQDALELELHPDPSSRMDDSDEDEEDSDDSSTQATTLVQLVDMESSPGVVEIETTARVPRQLKRRSSASDDDEEDNDEDEDDDPTDDVSQLDETYFYEYSMNHLMNDQQLNYRRSKLDRHERRRQNDTNNNEIDKIASTPTDVNELKIYSDSLQVVQQQQPTKTVNNDDDSQVNSTRSNHPRSKKLKTSA